VEVVVASQNLNCLILAQVMPEPVDLPSLRSQTNVNWSLAADEKDMDSPTHDMAAQCGGGGQPKSDLIRARTRL
jgi:hypothetical protein